MLDHSGESVTRETPHRALLAVVLLFAAIAAIPFVGPLARDEVLIFRDHADYFLPLRLFTADALRDGEVPFWNPYNASGERWLANPQTAVFYPPFWVFVALPAVQASHFYLWLHVTILGVGCYLLFSRFSSHRAALIAAMGVMLCGPTLSLLDVSNNLTTFAWLPFVLLCAMSSGHWSPSRAARDAAALALSFLGGEPLFALLAAFIYAVIIVSRRRDARAFAQITIVALLAILFVLPQLVLFAGTLIGSDRATGLPADVALKNSVRLIDWLMFPVPQISRNADLLTPNLSQQYIPSLFIPLSLLVMLLPAFIRRERAAPRLLFLSIAGCAIFFATASQLALFRDVAATLFTAVRYPARLLPFVAIAFGAMAAIGIESLGHLSRRHRFVVAIAALAMATVAIARVADFPQIAIAIAVDLLVTLLLIFNYSTERKTMTAIWVALVVTQMLISARPFFRSAPLDSLRTVYAPLLDKEMKVGRVSSLSDPGYVWSDTKRNMMSGYRNLFERQFDVSTAAPVIDQRYLTMHDLALTRPRLDLVDLLSVRFLLTERPLPPMLFQIALKIGSVRVYDNASAVRPVSVWSSVHAVATAHEAYKRSLASPGDQVEIFAAGVDRSIGRSATRVAQGSASWKFVGSNEVRIAVDLLEPAMVLLSQTDARGWNVTIDGQPRDKILANGLFRAVLVPAGRHIIIWRYSPPYFYGALLVSLIAISIAVAIVARASARRRRPINVVR